MWIVNITYIPLANSNYYRLAIYSICAVRLINIDIPLTYNYTKYRLAGIAQARMRRIATISFSFVIVCKNIDDHYFTVSHFGLLLSSVRSHQVIYFFSWTQKRNNKPVNSMCGDRKLCSISIIHRIKCTHENMVWLYELHMYTHSEERNSSFDDHISYHPFHLSWFRFVIDFFTFIFGLGS